MKLKYDCNFCSYSEIRHYRGDIIGEPYLGGRESMQVVNFSCPNCGVTQWDIHQRFSIAEKLYIAVYRRLTYVLARIGLKNRFLEKGESVEDWKERVTGNEAVTHLD